MPMRFASLQFCLLLIATLLLAACGGSKSKNGETSLDGLWSVDQVEHKGRVEKVKGDNLDLEVVDWSADMMWKLVSFCCMLAF